MNFIYSFSYSEDSNSELQQILSSVASHSSDSGLTIVQHMLGETTDRRPSSLAHETSIVNSLSLDLLMELCVPTSDTNTQRYSTLD